MAERQESLDGAGRQRSSGRLAANQTRSALGALDHNYDEFSLIELTDLNGKVLASSRSGVSIDVAGQDWFQDRRGWSAGGDLAVPPGRSASSGSSPSP